MVMLPKVNTKRFAAWYADYCVRKDAPTWAEMSRALRRDSDDLRGLCAIDMPFYQLWTKEALDVLAAWVRRQGFQRIVEVGAGDGCLTKWLAPRCPGVQLWATDDGSWRLSGVVLRADAREAPREYAADAVLSSWMPYRIDWTAAWREIETVRGYLLIGEGEAGCVGAEQSWAEHAGWESYDLLEFADTTLCRTDVYLEEDDWLTHSVARGWVRC